MRRCYEIDTAVVPAHRLPATIIDVCLDRDLDPHKLLRGTGIFREDVQAGNLMLRPEQCFRLIDNARTLGPAELPFLAGHRLFPGNHGAAGARLTNARHLLDAMQALERFSHCLSPLWTPRLTLDGDGASLYWSDTCGGENYAEFLNALMMTAISSFCRWLGGRAVPWHYALPGPLSHPEQYAVHWGPRVRANTHTCFMRVDRASLLAPWPRASTSAAAAAEQEVARSDSGMFTSGFVALVDDYLLNHIADNPSLEQLAGYLSVSPATLKRKLKKHHTHFQQRYDRVRQQLAIEWLTRRGFSVDDVARRLHFHDGRNLRRAFKRWTGVLPSSLNGAV